MTAAKCNVPPIGWVCSRPAGHDGPCAARRLEWNPKPISLDEVEVVTPLWHERHPWLNLFTAVSASILVTGVLLGIGLRWYLVWTVNNTVEQIKQGKTNEQWKR